MIPGNKIIRNFWECRDRRIDLSTPKIMGVVNVTPDSFSDGGKFYSTDKAIEHGIQLAKDGADILDVGGESTRPGAEDVSVLSELERVIPVIEELSLRGLTVSVDTSKPEVMIAAADAGAQIINDVYALKRPGAVEAAVKTGCGVCLMHMQGEPRTMQKHPSYMDMMFEIKIFFVRRVTELIDHGLPAENIVLDPGFGFGKTISQNFELLAKTEDFLVVGYPLLYGMSRKSSLGAVTGIKQADQRLTSSVTAHLLAIERGASIVRVHDVKQMKEALNVYYAMVHYLELT